jgi:acetylornithine/N-succinyldiaminopimelate aminotransferase
MNRLEMYDTFPLKIDKAEGSWIFDTNGKAYLDTFCGIGVLALGHSNSTVIQAVEDKIKRYSHVSNFFIDEDSETLAGKLLEHTGRKGKVFFTNSGTEAIEAAYKAIKKKCGGDPAKKVVAFKNGFHGRTLGALSLNGFENLKKNFRPLFQNVDILEYNDTEELTRYFEKNGRQVEAVFFEAVQGSGGVVPMENAFAQRLSEIHLEYQFLLVADEIQSGIGRTGKFYAYSHYELYPDIITAGKSIGGGLPLGAVIFLDDAQNLLVKGDHGSTFAPNPVSASAGLALLNGVESIIDSVEEKGAYLQNLLEETGIEGIKEIRRLGMMLGVEFENNLGELKARAFENKLLLNILHGHTIRLLPALNIVFLEMEEVVNRLRWSLCVNLPLSIS